jgi:hypothetical protein
MSTEISYPEKSRYMGREITLATAPIGAITNTDVLKNLAAPFGWPELISTSEGAIKVTSLLCGPNL